MLVSSLLNAPAKCDFLSSHVLQEIVSECLASLQDRKWSKIPVSRNKTPVQSENPGKAGMIFRSSQDSVMFEKKKFYPTIHKHEDEGVSGYVNIMSWAHFG